MKKYFLALTVVCFFFTSAAYSQSGTVITIKGKVVDNSTGDAVPNASVRIKNSAAGITTDATGSFRLTISALPVILLITHSTYEQSELDRKSVV